MIKSVPILLTRMVRLLDQLQRAFSRRLGKSKAVITVGVSHDVYYEQGFSQVLDTRNKYRNHLHMNKRPKETPYDSS